MNEKTRRIVPAAIIVFAVSVAVAVPYVTADSGMYEISGYDPAVMMIEGFEGAVPLPDDMSGDTILREHVTVSLAEAATGRDVIQGGIDIVANERGDMFLVWYLVPADESSMLYIVDAGDIDNTVHLARDFGMYDDATSVPEGGERAMVEAMAALVEEELSVLTGDAEIDAARAEYLTVFKEVREAYDNGNYDRVYELGRQLDRLSEHIGDIDWG